MDKKRDIFDGKTVIGLVEPLVIFGKDSRADVMAKVDTGATKSSIDISLAEKLKLGPVIEAKLVKSAHGNSIRPIIEADIMMAGKRISAKFNLADRKHMTYRILIGQNVLKNNFLIDPSRK